MLQKLVCLSGGSLWLLFPPFLLTAEENPEVTIPLYFQEQLNAAKVALEDNPAAAVSYYEMVLADALESGDRLKVAESHAKLGRASFLLGDYFRALGHHQEAFEQFEMLGEAASAAAELSAIGSTYYFSQAGDRLRALASFRDAARRYTALGKEVEAALNINYTGYVYWAQGDKEKALAIHRDALERLQATEDAEGIATALSDIGFTLNSLGRYEEALEASLQALAIEDAQGSILMQIPTLNNIGIACFKLGRLEEARAYGERSLALAEARGLLIRKYEATGLLHEVHRAMGEWEAAYRHLMWHKQLYDRVSISSQARMMIEADMDASFRMRSRVAAIQEEARLALIQESLRLERLRSIALVLVLILAGALTFSLWRHGRLKQASNQRLAAQKEALHQKNNELEAAMEKLRQSQSEIIRLEKDATLGVLTAGAAHEINNPMNVIRGALYALEDELQANGPINRDDVRTLLRQIEAGVERTCMIIKGLYAFSRQPAALSCVEVDGPAVLVDSLRAFEHPRRANVVLQEAGESGDCKVIADPGALRQIIQHLLDNACDAIGDDGCVVVGMRERSSEEGAFVELTVEDDGPGIAPEHLERIFDPFFTTKASGEGIGIGLTFVYRLVSDLGGSIRYDSRAEGGTRVCVLLSRSTDSK